MVGLLGLYVRHGYILVEVVIQPFLSNLNLGWFMIVVKTKKTKKHIADIFCSVLTIDFKNGTMLTFTALWLVAHNPLIGTRVFDIEAPPKLIFGGPGM